jgi:hypothetical protein
MPKLYREPLTWENVGGARVYRERSLPNTTSATRNTTNGATRATTGNGTPVGAETHPSLWPGHSTLSVIELRA